MAEWRVTDEVGLTVERKDVLMVSPKVESTVDSKVD